MSKKLIILTSMLSLALFACSNNQEDTTQEVQTESLVEETQAESEESEETESEASEETEETEETEESESQQSETEESIAVEEANYDESFDSLPQATQVAVIASFFDERVSAEFLDEMIYHVNYNFEGDNLLFQLHSGAGSGHPIYLLERQDNRYLPVDGVVSSGANQMNNYPPNQVEVTTEDLYAEYKAHSDIYDQIEDNGPLQNLTLESFYTMKDEVNEADSNENVSSIPVADTPVNHEVVGTVDGVTSTVVRFMTYQGSVVVAYTIHNDSSETISYSPEDFTLYKDGSSLPILDSDAGGQLAPGESADGYVAYEIRDLEPYILEWKGQQLQITPVVS